MAVDMDADSGSGSGGGAMEARFKATEEENAILFLRGGNLPFPRKLRETLASFSSLELDYQ